VKVLYARPLLSLLIGLCIVQTIVGIFMCLLQLSPFYCTSCITHL